MERNGSYCRHSVERVGPVTGVGIPRALVVARRASFAAGITVVSRVCARPRCKKCGQNARTPVTVSAYPFMHAM